jgi:hypothetical protein
VPNAERPSVRRNRRLAICLGLCLLSLLLGVLVVRLGLNWADTFPYSAASERRYLLVALSSLTVWFGGSALAIVNYRHH